MLFILRAVCELSRRCCIPQAAALGAKFALSPINPPGMIDACHELGVLAMPGAFARHPPLTRHFADIPSSSLLKHLLQVEGAQ